MRTIKADIELNKFVEKMQKGIAKGALAGVVSMYEKGEQLVVEFSRLGTSKIFYNLSKSESGFTANFIKEDIAFTHGVFRKEVENHLTMLMRRFHAEVN